MHIKDVIFLFMPIKPKKKDSTKDNVTVRNESQQRHQTKPRSSFNSTPKNKTPQPMVFSFRKGTEAKSDSRIFTRGKVL